ncbi:MAG: hypothetical protein AAGD33_12665 [Actinomycetota bacterium]
MAVTALFLDDHVSAAPGEAAALTLILHNPVDVERMVTLKPVGDLAEAISLQSQTIYLDPNESLEMPVTIEPPVTVAAGPHTCAIEVDDAGQTEQAQISVDVGASAGFSARLEPPVSKSGRAGRHKIVVDNSGNVPLALEVDVTASDDVAAELAATMVNVDPGRSARIELRVAPHSGFWSGVEIEHPFAVGLRSSSGDSRSLEGAYRQGPRVPSWLGPALAGFFGALLFWILAWLLFMRPSVENIAQDEAAELDAAQDERIAEQVDEIEAAAAEAARLPLGEPVDLRLEASAEAGGSDTNAFTFDENGTGRVLSITDVIIQNPGGAVGTVQIVRGDEVLLSSNLANFRDLEFHLVAPFRFESDTRVALAIGCTEPAPGSTTCDVAATILGFVDDT